MKIVALVALMFVLFLSARGCVIYRNEKDKELRKTIMQMKKTQVKRIEEEIIKLNNRYRNGD